MTLVPYICVAWAVDDNHGVDGFAVPDNPRRRQYMQDWCKEMNTKHGAETHWIREFLAPLGDPLVSDFENRYLQMEQVGLECTHAQTSERNLAEELIK